MPANSVRRPTDRKPTTGQKRISKRVKMFLLAMVQFLYMNARVLTNSLGKSDEYVFKV
jgi:hypothetical protein